jgi:VIT1/CCC1 family predicted Fe2+/Mn2+ transporter
MKERHGAGKAGRSGITIAIAYIAGGLLPLIPFFTYDSVLSAIRISMVLTLAGLTVSGFIKCRIRHLNPWTGTFRILIFAAIAAIGAYGVATLIAR